MSNKKIIAVAIGLVAVLLFFDNPVKEKTMGGISLSSCQSASATTSLIALSNNSTSTQTTFAAYEALKSSFPIYAALGTTTLTCDIHRADMVDINLIVAGSSTAHTLQITKEFSMNEKDWYGESAFTETSDQVRTRGVNPVVVDKWAPGTGATTTANFSVTPTAAKFIRVSVGSDGATSSVHLQINKRSRR